MDKWIKLTQEWVQKGVDGAKDVTFKIGDVIEVPEDMAKNLVNCGLAEATDKPESNMSEGLTKSLDSLTKTVTDVVETTLTKAIADASEKVAKSVPQYQVAKDENYDLEKSSGFKDVSHFIKCVQSAGMAAQGGAGLDISGMEFLTKAPSGQNISNDTEGNFAVPDVMSTIIWDNIEKDPADLINLTDRYTTAGTSLKIPRAFESSRKEGTGQRYAGITTTWLDEAGEIQPTKATIGRQSLELHKLGAVTYATEEMLDDQGFNFMGWVNDKVPRALGFAINQAIVEGTGVAKPKGFLNGDSLIVVPLESGQGNHTIFHRNVNKLYWRNWKRSTAIWLAHPDLVQQLEFMFFNDDTTNKRPIYLPANQVVASPFGVMYGRPVIPYEFMPDFGDQGDIAFVDMSQYATLTKAGGGAIKTASSIHIRFLFEETAFRFTARIDGSELWTSPKEDLKGDTTRSPFVVLASRTGGSTSSGL